MALVVADRVQETTTTIGTGTITLAGAVSGFQSFATIGNANTTYYCVTSGADWEVGIGTYTSAGTTLARTTILASSAAGAAITLTGTSNVFCVYPASKAVYEDENGNVVITVNSTGDALRITQTGAGNALLVEDSANPDSSPFVINASGSVGMGGTTVPAGTNFYNIKTLTGAVDPFSNRTVATVQTDATGIARGYTTSIGVVAAHPTLSSLQHFLAAQASFNGSTVTDQRGFYVSPTLVGATNNYAFIADDFSATTGTAYGFYSNSNISGTGTTYNFYAAGTAPNVFTGTVNIGSTGVAGTNFYNAKTITGATVANANYTNATVQSGVTSQARGYYSQLATAASAFTLTTLRHFHASQGTIGAGSTVTQQIGFLSESNLIGATANYGFFASNTAATTGTAYGFFSAINTPTAGGTTWGFYADGTANNLFRGNTYHGNTAVTPTAKIHVAAGSATASTAPLKFTSGTNLTAIEAGVVEYDGTIMTATPNANFKRGTIPITNYTSGVGVSLTAAAEATLQDLLPAANDTITLSIGTYFLDLACTFTRGTVSTTSAQAQINILGTGGAVGSFSGMSLSSPTAGGATANFAFNAVNINVSNVVTAASTTISGVYTITLRGMLKITTAGTIDPQYNLSANLTSAGTATAPNVLYFRLQQIDTQSAAAFGPAGTGWG